MKIRTLIAMQLFCMHPTSWEQEAATITAAKAHKLQEQSARATPDQIKPTDSCNVANVVHDARTRSTLIPDHRPGEFANFALIPTLPQSLIDNQFVKFAEYVRFLDFSNLVHRILMLAWFGSSFASANWSCGVLLKSSCNSCNLETEVLRSP